MSLSTPKIEILSSGNRYDMCMVGLIKRLIFRNTGSGQKWTRGVMRASKWHILKMHSKITILYSTDRYSVGYVGMAKKLIFRSIGTGQNWQGGLWDYLFEILSKCTQTSWFRTQLTDVMLAVLGWQRNRFLERLELRRCYYEIITDRLKLDPMSRIVRNR